MELLLLTALVHLDLLVKYFYCQCHRIQWNQNCFLGDLCEEDLNECESNPCWNNGSCVDGPNGYVCQCLAGISNIILTFQQALLLLLLGYSGIHCEVDIAVCNITDEARCQNAGVCEEGPGDTFSCNCQPGSLILSPRSILLLYTCFFFNLGWEGFLCDIESNECMSAPCQNGAVCIDLHANYECACLFGKLYSVELNNFKAILFIWL